MSIMKKGSQNLPCMLLDEICAASQGDTIASLILSIGHSLGKSIATHILSNTQGDGDNFMKMKDREDIEPVWQEYMQEQFDITETKLKEKKDIVRAFLTLHYPLLNFWYARQEAGEGPTFLFKAWRNKDGDMVALVVSNKSPSHWTCEVRKQQRVIMQRPQDSSTKAKSDTHLEEDDADVDLADDRSLQKRPRRAAGPLSALEGGTAVSRSIPKPQLVKPVKTGRNMLLAPKRIRGKKEVIEAPARTTQMLDTQDSVILSN
ncbi:hypothetical protein EV702DRAFT_1044503 [Suillus placidus]|uniref:Uncharacterized protein n=1 Tax=Suillus placidus TaxID=48579 RepID=A0A9P6ZYB2_9AGAM|nr:hypothetical protein EV702DRAFT_1044503 [Suillus placidus]